MERIRISSISSAAALESLYIETVPGFYALPDILDTAFGLSTVFVGKHCQCVGAGRFNGRCPTLFGRW